MFDLLMQAAPSAWRRAREPLARALLARRGAARTVNGVPLRVDPVGRHVFTSTHDEGAAACLRTHLRATRSGSTGRSCWIGVIRSRPKGSRFQMQQEKERRGALGHLTS